MTAGPRRVSLLVWPLAIIAVVLAALAPWWRNHAYLRDLYDYGLVIAANGHLNLGERPYVDFTTPIQAGFLGLNWLIERAGGGTYAALTRGAALLIVAAGMLLPALLGARRWPWWAAVVVGGAIAISAPSQHTILWHNALGVVALAAAGWAVAAEPVLRRAAWPWHAVAAAGLFLGGINKLNYQLVAVALACAWTLRAGFLRSAGWDRVLASIGAILGVGIVLPLAAELAWTGASPRLWFANVVLLPAGGRTGILHEIFTVNFWIRPIHNYYGPLLLPQVGLVAIWLVVGAVVGCWPGKDGNRADRVLLPVAALLVLAAGAALLATNYEIAVLGLGAWLALVASLWLGFAPARRGPAFVAGLVLPALLLGATAWWSAWLGQRSQFGYSDAPRSAYRSPTEASPAFSYLAGLRLSPELVVSLQAAAQWMPQADEHGNHPVFFGLGTEWMERGFPTTGGKKRPLWVHWQTSYGPAEMAELNRRLAEQDYRLVLTTLARDEWPAELRTTLNMQYSSVLVGPVVKGWSPRGDDVVNLLDSFETLHLLGGNVAGPLLLQDRHPLRFRQTAAGRRLMGSGWRPASVQLRTPSYRLRGTAALDRLPNAPAGAGTAHFKIIFHGSIPEEVRWEAKVTLPAGETSVSVPFEFDTLGRMVELWVIPGEGMQASNGLFAGYRDLELTNSIESTEGDGVPWLRLPAREVTPPTPALAESFFGPITWRPQRWVVRGGRAAEGGLELAPGGETWLHTDAMTGEVRGQIRLAGSGAQPYVHVVWYKGGRLQLMQHGRVAPDRPFDIHVWTAEPGGWIGVLVDRQDDASAVLVRLTSSSLSP